MGEVYRARDTQLDRDVAVKVLPDAVAQNPERLERFESEAKAVARLPHPNILAIHDSIWPWSGFGTGPIGSLPERPGPPSVSGMPLHTQGDATRPRQDSRARPARPDTCTPV